MYAGANMGHPSREEGFVLEDDGVSSGNWFEGSQVSKARPGAPFGFTLRYGTSFVISLPTRLSESPARDDKGEGGGCVESGCRIENVHPPFIFLRG